MENIKSPVVSVILPVYNGAAHVRAAIDSILAQTFTDFELIVIDDGSVDATVQIVEQVNDPRLILTRQENRGLAATLNRGISLARGKYLARQDHDDISLPDRFAKQVAFLEADPDCVLLGTRALIWEGNRPTDRRHDHPTGDYVLRFAILFDNYFVHSSVMMRREAVAALGGYSTDPLRQPPEDYELWSRIARRYKVANLPEPLLIYREVPGSVCRTFSFQDRLVKICSENLAYAAGLDAPNIDTQDIAAILHREPLLRSVKPDHKRMKSIIRRAARHIAPGGEADKNAEALIDRLKHMTLLIYFDRLPPWVQGLIKKARSAILG